MKIAHFAVAALLSFGSAAVAVEPVVAAPMHAPATSVGKSDVVQVRHREYRRDGRYSWRHGRRDWRDERWGYERHPWRPWYAERGWRERHYWRYRLPYYWM